MTQSVGRARRFGQKKKVHIHRFVALKTIDVDILEHRERRSDALYVFDGDAHPAPAPTVVTEPVPAAVEKTKLARGANGQLALVPRSWVVAEQKNGWDGSEDFTSLVKYSQAFADEDLDD